MSFVLLVRTARKVWRNELPPSSSYKIRQLPVSVVLICTAVHLGRQKMKVTGTSYPGTQRYIADDRNPQLHRR